ncbi:MAG: 4-hydroxy-tetrahydrodipicolinate synthase, partial [Bacteroidales bacterium]|nr:4-hydroxy-tetrahydrodipicolinate synthase [Bacteroidales bacterium]
MEAVQKYTGTGVAMVTPFNQSGEVDYDALILHTERLIKNGVNYLVVLGTTAETPTLSRQEKQDVVRCVVDACGGRVPIVVGAGGNDTRSAIESIQKLDHDGVDALLSVVPYYNKPTQEGIYQHFSAIAAASTLPLMLYNVPGRTGSNMTSGTVLRLAADHPGVIVAVKEASGNFEQLMEILKEKPRDFQVVSGDDAITLPMIALGGSGVVSVIGNGYPAMFSTMVAAALEGAHEKARELHYRLFPMMKAIFKEGNPAGVKASMEVQGWIRNVLRLPLVPATDALYREIRELDSML